VEAVVTNVNTGLAEYHEMDRRQVPNQLLIASCSIPLMFPMAELAGQPYLDGGCSDAIPWRRALEVGCDRVVVLLTQPRDYSKSIDSTLTLIEQSFRKYPAFVDTMRHRAERYNASREELFAREASGDLIVIAPEDTFGCSRTERDTEILRALWQSGYFAGRKVSETIRSFWRE
jgi:predicted patatin/cPLA2 family phospholipase